MRFNSFYDLTKIEKNVYYPTKKIINYIIKFEIINENIKSFFIQNKIVEEFHLISGFYYAEHNKIVIGFNLNKKNIYEIGKFKRYDNEFIIEYYIEAINNETNEILMNFFVQNGINNLIDNHCNNNEIRIDNNNNWLLL